MLALLKIAVYEDDGLMCVDAIEPKKGGGQIRNLELRKRFIRTIKAFERSSARAG